MFFNFIIWIALKCSIVYGYGQGIFDAIKRRAASITAAPVSIVLINISCPGQSTKETCLFKLNLFDTLSAISNGTFANKVITIDPFTRTSSGGTFNYNTYFGTSQNLNKKAITNNYKK